MNQELWFWFGFCIAAVLVVANVLFCFWLLGRFELTDEGALETGHQPIPCPSPTKTLPSAHAGRHRSFNQVRREAVSAALKDFGQQARTTNPYPVGSAAYATWASNYQRVRGDQLHFAAQQEKG